jgi:hypothetical protein
MDKLIALIVRYIRSRQGSVYTSTRLRNNPDVCHAACIWFMDYCKRISLMSAIAKLDQLNKHTLKRTQQQIGRGPTMMRELVNQVRNSNQMVSDEDISTLSGLLDQWRQPTDYTSSRSAVVRQAIRSMRTTADRVMIYMRGHSGAGHVICIVRNVGGVAIYDPNIGVITARLTDVEGWGAVLGMILEWYAKNMGLTLVASQARV